MCADGAPWHHHCRPPGVLSLEMNLLGSWKGPLVNDSSSAGTWFVDQACYSSPLVSRCPCVSARGMTTRPMQTTAKQVAMET